MTPPGKRSPLCGLLLCAAARQHDRLVAHLPVARMG